MKLPARWPNAWLQVTERLAREVAVQHYIHDIDAPQGGGRGGGSPRPSRIAQAAVLLAVLTVGLLAGPAILWACGLRAATPAQLRLADAVLSIDPHAEHWTDERLRNRIELRREAIELIENTLTTPTASTFPYLSILSGRPSPIVEPGTAPGLLMLGHALDQFPAAQRGHMMQAIVALALALDDPDLQQTLTVLAAIPREIRSRLVANRAAGLKHLFAGELAFQDATVDRDGLQEKLAAEQTALDLERKALAATLGAVEQHRRTLSAADRRCAAAYAPLRACLAGAAQEQVTP